MPINFKKAETPGRAVRRVCRAYLGRALLRLRSSRHPATVHAVRKEIKKLRATLRLVQAEINRSELRKLEKALRRAAGQLAAPRDARVMLKAFEKLAGRTSTTRFPQLYKTLQKNCLQESRRFRGDDSAVLSEQVLRKAGRRFIRLKVAAKGWPAIEPGLRESYLAGRKGRDLVRHEPTEEHFHDWRKHVKVFWYQLRLVCPAWPASGRTLINRLGRLGELLGDDHDLAILQRFATDHELTGETAAVNRLITLQQRKLRLAASKLGAQIYHEEPAIVCRRLGKTWTAWHG